MQWCERLRVGLVAAPAFLGLGCVDDPPAPLTCPPPAQQRLLPVAPIDAAFVGLGACGVQPSESSRFTRKVCQSTQSEQCDLDTECPPPTRGCFPSGDCPQPVRDEVSGVVGEEATATCLKLEDFPGYSTPVCWCGCRACASECDGTGPVLFGRNLLPEDAGGGSILPELPPVMFQTKVIDQLPDEGLLGIYLRVRGRIDAKVIVRTPILRQLGGLPVHEYDVEGDFEEFTDIVLFSQGPGIYGWTRVTADASPETAEAGLLQDAGEEFGFGEDLIKPEIIEIIPDRGPTSAELDCMIPFWSPR